MNEETNLPEGLQLAVKLLAQIGDDDSDRAIAAVHAACDLAQRVADLEAEVKRLAPTADNVRYTAEQDWSGLPGSTAFLFIERHADGWSGISDMMEAWRDAEVQRVTATKDKRIADLETKCDTLKRLHDAATDERDALAQQHRSQHDADSAELRQLCADRDAAREERDNLIDAMREEIDEGLRLRELGGALPDENITSMTERVIKERDAMRARLAEIEAQEPVAVIGSGYSIHYAGAEPISAVAARHGLKVGSALYARPVPAQAVPAGRRLVPVEPTIAMCIAGDSPRMLVDDCTPTPAIYRAMIAAAPEAAR